ncbi:hypothetical protein DENSPDRAFT_489167 [Dentipellis sp. KUC8613]|nr:hypothetical protein DENSPDRAFT_489167 [Dentipellis sp. KUC8613]
MLRLEIRVLQQKLGGLIYLGGVRRGKAKNCKDGESRGRGAGIQGGSVRRSDQSHTSYTSLPNKHAQTSSLFPPSQTHCPVSGRPVSGTGLHQSPCTISLPIYRTASAPVQSHSNHAIASLVSARPMAMATPVRHAVTPIADLPRISFAVDIPHA